MSNHKSLSPVISQLIERKLGMYASSYLGNDIYFLVEAINILISSIGEETVKENFIKDGKDWEKTKKKLMGISKLSTRTKIFYDSLQDKKLVKQDVDKVEIAMRKHFFKTASKISAMQREIYDLFIYLVDGTSIKHKSISSDAFKILEHSGTGKFDMTRRGMTPPGTMDFPEPRT